MNPHDAFFTLHRELPREGPGHPDSTARALFEIPTLVARPRVLDLGCGPGAQTIDLARLLPDARIVAVDTHAPFLAELRARAARAGVQDQIETVQGDMAAPPAGPYDLVWSEGAAYLLGVERALAEWPRLLEPGGALAFSDAVWLTDEVPDRVRAFWQEYPDMTTLPARREHIRQAGLVLHGDFVLPDRDWWEGYYTPLEERIAQLRPGAPPALQAVLDEGVQEIEIRRAFPSVYGYAFFVAGVPEGDA